VGGGGSLELLCLPALEVVGSSPLRLLLLLLLLLLVVVLLLMLLLLLLRFNYFLNSN